MPDWIIMAVVVVVFPLFGLAVFFFWRYKYGVWSIKHRDRRDPRDVHVVTDLPPRDTPPPL